MSKLGYDRGKLNDEIKEQDLATVVVAIDSTIVDQRNQNVTRHDNKDLIGSYTPGTSLTVEKGQLIFSKDPSSDPVVTGSSRSGFTKFDGCVITERFHRDYVFRGVSQTQLDPLSPISKNGISAIVRGSAMYYHPDAPAIFPGKALIWDVRDSNKKSDEKYIYEGAPTLHGPPRKRARLVSDVQALAYLRPIDKTDILQFSTDAVDRALNAKEDNVRVFNKSLSQLIPATNAVQPPKPLSRDDDVMLSTVKLPIAAIALATLLTFYQHDLIEFKNQDPRRRTPPMSFPDNRLNEFARMLDLAGGVTPSETNGPVMDDILRKVYWDYASNRSSDMRNNPDVWCRDAPTARTLLTSYKPLVAAGYMDEFIELSSRIVAEGGSIMGANDSGLIIL